MRDAMRMWGYSRMCVLTALTAAIYAAVLIPFKPITIIPGFTEVRPASVIPIICSIMFGPAGAWGSAFGNLIGDLFGTLGPGSIFGFFGNFLYGYIPYKLWNIFGMPSPTTGRGVLAILISAAISSITCGVFIGWGVDLLGFVPFATLGNIIWINNLLVSAILAPPLLILLLERARRWGLLYTQVMAEGDLKGPGLYIIGLILLVVGSIGGLIAGNAISFGIYKSQIGSVGIGTGLLPFIMSILAGAVLI
jgi:energy-coupling factor transport system substrate-specific component